MRFEIALLVLGALVAVIPTIAFIVKAINDDHKFAIGAVVSLIVGIALLLWGGSFETVPTGYTGVKVSWGQIQDEYCPEGINPCAIIKDDIVLVSNKLQSKSYSSRVWGETSEQTVVYAEGVDVTYYIPVESSVWVLKYITDSDYIKASYVQSAVKNAMVKLDAKSVTIRKNIEPAIIEELQLILDNTYTENAIKVKNVSVTNMDFEDDYNAAIAERSKKQLEATQLEIELEMQEKQAQSEANVAKTKAEAEAAAKRIAAEAEAEAAKIKADSDAYVILAKAEAEAEANNKVRASLTDELLKKILYEQWDGKLPTYSGDGNWLFEVQ